MRVQSRERSPSDSWAKDYFIKEVREVLNHKLSEMGGHIGLLFISQMRRLRPERVRCLKSYGKNMAAFRLEFRFHNFLPNGLFK